MQSVSVPVILFTRRSLPALRGLRFGGSDFSRADDLAHQHPVEGSTSAHQGIRGYFANGARIVLPLSGTGADGAMLRVYLERFEPGAARHALADITGITGRDGSSGVV